ncbi:hypothetical protein ACEPAG_3880 [Sanghuangporus baumii]
MELGAEHTGNSKTPGDAWSYVPSDGTVTQHTEQTGNTSSEALGASVVLSPAPAQSFSQSCYQQESEGLRTLSVNDLTKGLERNYNKVGRRKVFDMSAKVTVEERAMQYLLSTQVILLDIGTDFDLVFT